MKTREGCQGKKFGRLTVLGHEFRIDRRWRAVVRCECGAGRVVLVASIKCGQTKSCGCLQREMSGGKVTHGCQPRRLYRTWSDMLKRCRNPTSTAWERYGGRGISVCHEWESSFVPFRDWALANGYSDELEIDRIDNDGNYEPSNCRWVTRTENMRNSSQAVLSVEKVEKIRSMLGEKAWTHKKIAQEFGVARGTISKIAQGRHWREK